MRLIDADSLMDKVRKGLQVGGVLDRIPPYFVDDTPTVDAVVVTRCKDCKHGEAYDRMDGTKGIYCRCPNAILLYGNGSIFTPVRENLDFCSYGKPKEG